MRSLSREARWRDIQRLQESTQRILDRTQRDLAELKRRQPGYAGADAPLVRQSRPISIWK